MSLLFSPFVSLPSYYGGRVAVGRASTNILATHNRACLQIYVKAMNHILVLKEMYTFLAIVTVSLKQLSYRSLYLCYVISFHMTLVKIGNSYFSCSF